MAELAFREKINSDTNKLVNNFHLYSDELDKSARDPKLQPMQRRCNSVNASNSKKIFRPIPK